MNEKQTQIADKIAAIALSDCSYGLYGSIVRGMLVGNFNFVRSVDVHSDIAYWPRFINKLIQEEEFRVAVVPILHIDNNRIAHYTTQIRLQVTQTVNDDCSPVLVNLTHTDLMPLLVDVDCLAMNQTGLSVQKSYMYHHGKNIKSFANIVDRIRNRKFTMIEGVSEKETSIIWTELTRYGWVSDEG